MAAQDWSVWKYLSSQLVQNCMKLTASKQACTFPQTEEVQGFRPCITYADTSLPFSKWDKVRDRLLSQNVMFVSSEVK